MFIVVYLSLLWDYQSTITQIFLFLTLAGTNILLYYAQKQTFHFNCIVMITNYKVKYIYASLMHSTFLCAHMLTFCVILTVEFTVILSFQQIRGMGFKLGSLCFELLCIDNTFKAGYRLTLIYTNNMLLN